MFYKSLLRLSVGGCLLFLAFMAGAGVVAYTLFSKPRIDARAPLTVSPPAARAPASSDRDVALFAYQPGNDTTLLVVTQRRTAVVLPRTVRVYARDSVQPDMDLDIVGGLGARLVLKGINGTQSVDTVFRSLSFRDVVRLSLARSSSTRIPAGARARACGLVLDPTNAPAAARAPRDHTDSPRPHETRRRAWSRSARSDLAHPATARTRMRRVGSPRRYRGA